MGDRAERTSDGDVRSRPRAGRWSRRRLLGGAAAALPVGQALLGGRAVAGTRVQDGGRTLVIALSGSPVDIDPHGANEYRSALTIRGAFEQLIALTGDATDAYEGLVAESWSANEDRSVWTFTIRPNVAFHDGTPCDAEAVRLSFERLLTLGLGPGFEFSRFVSDPAQVSAPDPATVVFDLGRENLVRIPTMEPLRGTRDHVGELFESTSSAQELVDTITGG